MRIDVYFHDGTGDDIARELRGIRRLLAVFVRKSLGQLDAEQEAALAREAQALAGDLSHATESLQAAIDAEKKPAP